jgi:hypothetical protein
MKKTLLLVCSMLKSAPAICAANRQLRYGLLSLVGLSLYIVLAISGEARRQGPAVCGTISDCAYQLLNQRAAANRNNFYIYKDADSAFNHGFPSGLFGTIDLSNVGLDSGCVDDPASPTGCSADPARFDTTRGTVFRFNYPALSGSDFVGLNWQDPEDFNGQPTFGAGYDLTPATSVQFEARSPNGAKVHFGVGGCVTNFYQLGPAWSTITISTADLIPPPGPSNATCPPDLTNTHLLFTVATNAAMSPSGGTVLLDNIQFLPVPVRQGTDPKTLSLPLGNLTFGSVLQNDVTPDQANRNLAPIYEAAATILSLLKRGRPEDVTNALSVADALSYALHHDNHGIPLPAAPDGSVGLRSAYQGGDIALLNGQSSATGAQAGDVRLAGFSVKDSQLCGPNKFCLVLDGATGGNNAWAMLALLAAYLQSGNNKYLTDAEIIGKWIVGTLRDTTTPDTNPPGYGGYFVGFADGGNYFLIKGKSTENNGDIFVAFSLVAQIEGARGNTTTAAQWQNWANWAGDFVMRMFDPDNGRFYAGTVSAEPPSPPNPVRGNCQIPFMQKGNDIVNTCDFLDSNTFTALPMAASPQYRDQIDWRRPMQYVLDHFAQTVTAGGRTYSGYNIVSNPSSGPNGVAWEFTGQAVVTARFIDSLYNQSIFANAADFTLNQIRQAQISAPFGDGLGLPASTLQDGDTLPPLKQCLDTPFQCIPERVGLAATNWAIYADLAFNPLWFGSLAFSPLTPPFPQQLIGTTSPASRITVTNTATASVTFAGISLTGPNSSDFTVNDNCHSSPLAAGATCTITVNFTPSAAGARTATLVIRDDALGSPQTIALSGAGIPPNDFLLRVSPDQQSRVAGNQAVYSVQTQIVRGSAQPVALSVSCPGLSCNVAPTNINSGGSATLTVFTTAGTSPKAYTITVTGTGQEVTHTAGTNLSVTPAASVSPTSLIFPTQQTGTSSAPRTVTLTNHSPSNLVIRAVSIGGDFSADFVRTGNSNCGSVLGAGASCTINVSFTPTGVGERRATLFVLDNTGGSPLSVDMSGAGVGACTSISDCGLQLLNRRASENQISFFVYKDADSGLNHGFPSGLFGPINLNQVVLDSACIDDPLSPTGCATDPAKMDAARGTVFRITFPPLSSGEFVGLSFQDPQNYDPARTPGNGYDLRPATTVKFDVRSPDRARVQFGVGGCVSEFFTLDPSWMTLTIPLSSLQPPDFGSSCPPDTSNTHLLFTVVTNVDNAPQGGTVLVDNIQFTPTPARQKTDPEALSLPVSTQTLGVVANRRLPIPTDQVNRNLATISESALTMIALLERKQPEDVANALKIADAFHYALYHDNHGDPIPTAPQSSSGCYSGSPAPQCGLHTAYINGDIAFLNHQPAPALGQAGDVRLAGFSSGTALCGPSGFCLVLDGATGGDNAWAMMALIAAYKQSGDTKYLNDAIVIGNWIFANLADGRGYGGYVVGYNDGGLPKQLILGKSTTHNAQISIAFSRLAQVEEARGNSAAAAQWANRAGAAANFVLQMFDSTTGRFYPGTVHVTGAGIQGPGICPDLSKRNGDDIVNTCDSLDSITVVALALASSYPNAIDWTRPIRYALNRFTQTITAGGKSYSGFNLIPPQGVEKAGVAWEFTAQMALAMNIIGASSGVPQFVNSASFYLNQIGQAQISAPFGDGQGLVGSTLLNGDTLPPYMHCLSTPFQCIPERVGLSATTWSVFADRNFSPLSITGGGDPGCTTIAVNPATLFTGFVDTVYHQTFTATGGTLPYSFGVISGALPSGMSLSSDGMLTGMPTAAGAYSFTVRATSANGCFGERAYTLQVNQIELARLQYYPLPSPIRLLDTRPGENACDAPNAPLGDNAVRLQQATGACSGIPSTAKAIVGNATVVNFISPGFHWVTLYPSDAAQPNASNLNFSDNQIVPNAFTVGLGADGKFNIYSHASTHFIVDITGYYAPPGQGGLYFHPLPVPLRLLDTRVGETACDAPEVPLADNGTRTVTAHRTCLGSIIPSSAKAIAGNATVVNFITSGFNYITLYPFGTTRPNASNLNFTTTQIVPNAFVAGLSADGKFDIYSSGGTDFIVDVAGYFSNEAVDVNGQGLLYNPLPIPVRLLDTRPGENGCDAPGVPLGDDATRTQTTHRSCFGVGIPKTAKAVVGNGTVVNFISSGFHYITLYPFGATRPNASNLNFIADQIVPNAFVVGLGNDGKFNIYSHASTHFIVDLTGYFVP